MAKNDIKVINEIEINGEYVPWDSLSDEDKRYYGNAICTRLASAFGLVPINKQERRASA